MKNPKFVCSKCGNKWPTTEGNDNYCPKCNSPAQAEIEGEVEEEEA